MSFMIFENEKYSFQGYEKKKFKKLVLVQKWTFFNFSFLGNIGLENVFYDSLETKNAFLGYKNNTFKKGEKLAFFQRG